MLATSSGLAAIRAPAAADSGRLGASTTAATPLHPSRADFAQGSDRYGQGARHRIRVPADQIDAVLFLIPRQSAAETGNPIFRDTLRQKDIHQLGARDRPLRGKVRKIDPQGLAPNEVGGIVSPEMDALDDCVGLDDELVVGTWDDHGVVVTQSECAGSPTRKGREVARDEFEFTR